MKKILAVLLVCLMAAALAACSGKKTEEPTEEYDPEGIGSYNLYAGVVTTAGEVKIEKNSEYVIEEIKVEVGDSVKKGDVLFTYDVSQVSLNIERAQLELEQLNNTYTNLENTKADLQRQKANASEDMQLEYSLEIKETEAEMLETSYSIKMKQQELEQLNNVYKDSSVTSPVSGKVKSINTDENNYTAPFMTISESENLVVMGYVNETNISELFIGMEVVILSRIDDSSWTGRITKIDTESPAQNNDDYYGYLESGENTGTSSKYPFYVELDSSDGLLMGQHVYIGPTQASDLIDYNYEDYAIDEYYGDDIIEGGEEYSDDGVIFDGADVPEGDYLEGETIPEGETHE